MYSYSIKLLVLCCTILAFQGYGQQAARDSLKKSEKYGLRVGVDLSRPLISALNDQYQGIEITGDFRIGQRLFLAAELGNESRTVEELLDNEPKVNVLTLYDFTSSGSYAKVGVDYNTYENWYGMNNSLFVGARYAFSTFTKTLNNYSLYDSNRYWTPEGFVPGSEALGEYSGLNASWLELVLGAKAELFANFYLGASVRLGVLITNKESEVMSNLWIPGFNRKTDGSRFGLGFNYTLSYFLPLYRKAREKTAPPPK
ncbi:DUF6048 family protein [Robiginitalea marina]|uniref:DUF6048 family protein n=1 Tax=Robiginitalea marina TaxID=2954105 RepID=A0ABT1AVV7_9FLAO|nr:DUF6048 family protein [Robiginitalea marina]MCO5723765.1 DUF6048 family protein [Robiginitalea marina]